MTDNLYVAKTIMSQIHTADPSALMAWGTHNKVGSDRETDICEYDHNVKSEKPYYKDFGCRGWVQFDVNGLKFQGRVYVGLNALDYYDVLLVKITEHKDFTYSAKIMGDKRDIFCEDLMTTIDHLIERD